MKKNIILIVVLAVVFGGVGVGAATFLGKKAPEDDKTESKAKTKSHKKSHEKSSESSTPFPLDDFVVNLADTDEQHYLKATVVLDLNMEGGKEIEEEMKGITPKMRDAVLMLMSRHRFRELQTVKGKQMLKEEMKKEINRVLDDELVSSVYFTAFAMQ